MFLRGLQLLIAVIIESFFSLELAHAQSEWATAELSVGRRLTAATSVGNFALIGGGRTPTGNFQPNVVRVATQLSCN
jgi:hypothetical protein